MLCSLSIFPSGWFINWESKKQKDYFIKSGLYVPKNILPTRFQMYNDTVIVTLPRFHSGVPFSLGMLNFNDYCKAEPLMSPYPNWNAHLREIDQSIHNAIDVVVDGNDILWILDIGVVNTMATPELIETPKIIGLSLKTKQVIKTVSLGPVTTDQSNFQYIQVEIVDKKTFIYVSDGGTNSIIVWNIMKGHGYKVVLPDQVRESDCDKSNDVLYITLLEGRIIHKHALFFTYLHSKNVYHIETHHLREGRTEGVIQEDGLKPGRMVFLGSDGGPVLFFRLRGKSDIFLWNTTEEFRAENLVLAQPINMGRYPTHVSPGYRSLIWAIESNFPNYLQNEIDNVGPNVKIHPVVKYCE